MQVSVKLVGIELAQKALREIGKKVDPVLRGALNTTANKSRTERYVNPLKGSIAAPKIRKAMKVKRANSRRMESRIIPSSAGIPVLEYKSWGYDPIDATRGRIWVRGPNGRKVAAGFVNPSSSGKKPLSTRSDKRTQRKAYSYKKALSGAIGLSSAYWFKQLTTAQTVRWINTFLQQEFNSRFQKELRK